MSLLLVTVAFSVVTVAPFNSGKLISQRICPHIYRLYFSLYSEKLCKDQTVQYLAPKFTRACLSALLDLVTCMNITFAPVLTSVELEFHQATLKLFWLQVPLEDESLLYFSMFFPGGLVSITPQLFFIQT